MQFLFDYYYVLVMLAIVLFVVDVAVYRLATPKPNWPFQGPWALTHAVMFLVGVLAPVLNLVTVIALVCFLLIQLLSYFTDSEQVPS